MSIDDNNTDDEQVIIIHHESFLQDFDDIDYKPRSIDDDADEEMAIKYNY